MDDKQIVTMLWKRESPVLQIISEKYGALLHRIARNILTLPQDAEETVNDTFLAVWNAIPPARPDPFGAYLCRTCRNLAVSRLRSRAAEKRGGGYDLCLDELSQAVPTPSPEETLDAWELGRHIDRFLRVLPRNDRILFVRRYWLGDSVKDAAAHLSISENTASVRLHRIREKLKNYLIKEGFIHEAR